MEKEFNLSDKILKDGPVRRVIEEDDVKEFIRRLKDEFYRKWYIDDSFELTAKGFEEILDKLAGSKLI